MNDLTESEIKLCETYCKCRGCVLYGICPNFDYHPSDVEIEEALKRRVKK